MTAWMAFAAALMEVAALATTVPPIITPAPDRVHRLELGDQKGWAGEMVAGADHDLWTLSGFHFRTNGERLGRLTSKVFDIDSSSTQINSLRADAKGFVYVTGHHGDFGSFLSRHDAKGHQLWIRRVGRSPPNSEPQPDDPGLSDSNRIDTGLRSDIVGIDGSGNVFVRGAFVGCFRLGDAERERPTCATKANAGFPEKWDDETDSYPQLSFVNEYSPEGKHLHTYLLPRHHVVAAAISSAGSLAVVSRWSGAAKLRVRSPAGESIDIHPTPRALAASSMVYLTLYGADGHLRSKHEFESSDQVAAKGMEFDRDAKLWLLLFSGREVPAIDRPWRPRTPPPPDSGGPRGKRDDPSCSEQLTYLSIATDSDSAGDGNAPKIIWSICRPVDAEIRVGLSMSPDGGGAVIANLPVGPAASGATKRRRSGELCCLAVLDANGAVTGVLPESTLFALALPGPTVCYAGRDEIGCVDLATPTR
jgi:hypothetical protein